MAAKISSDHSIPPAENSSGSSPRRLADALRHPQISPTRQNFSDMAKRRPHRTGSIFQRGGIWWIQFHVNGARQRESSYSSEKTEAERLLKRRLAAAAVGKIKEFVPSSTTVSQ